MEQTKAKTAEEILCKYLGEYWWIMGKYRRPAINAAEKFAHQKTIELQSHIANLEAERDQANRTLTFLRGEISKIRNFVFEPSNNIGHPCQNIFEAVQEHISNLEAQNKELKGLIKELLGMAKDGYRLHIKNCSHQEFLEEDLDKLSRAEQALKEDKKDG